MKLNTEDVGVQAAKVKKACYPIREQATVQCSGANDHLGALLCRCLARQQRGAVRVGQWVLSRIWGGMC